MLPAVVPGVNDQAPVALTVCTTPALGRTGEAPVLATDISQLSRRLTGVSCSSTLAAGLLARLRFAQGSPVGPGPDGRVRPDIDQREVISQLAEVRVGENETFEAALRRFNKKIQQSGILAEARRREHYEKPSVKRKRKEAKRKKAARGE